MKQISSATWLKETSRLVDRMLLNDETDAAARLFQAQILITERRVNEAKWVYIDYHGKRNPSSGEDVHRILRRIRNTEKIQLFPSKCVIIPVDI